ncbi:ribonuclease HII [Lentibacillus sp. CBA3610]|uniref:ribonuclease HII n=1 Tax=Lentibacillus sp. CBA3610 TaxID=2518176 RepID=UPI0015960E62|nr:ribonuclease HII [Lentibacillus sp. CBA3610]QKY71599.1 ribonuclease HII [Lentibacillus sp. CBA3610]
MEKQSITVLKQLFEADKLNETYINELKSDKRKGVQQLIERYERKKLNEKALEENFIRMCRHEQRNYSDDCHYIAGVDEAGRGPLAGPVVAAAVILPRDFKLLGLNDSKQLNEATRDEYFSIIKNEAVSCGISIIDNLKIDQVNIYEATKLAMYDAVNQLDPSPDHVLIDAVSLDQLPCTSEAITKGDQESISIAAASILAKVTRDNLMKSLHKEYPAYGFASNMGYGTKQHLDILKEQGITPYHRKSFAPVLLAE